MNGPEPLDRAADQRRRDAARPVRSAAAADPRGDDRGARRDVHGQAPRLDPRDEPDPALPPRQPAGRARAHRRRLPARRVRDHRDELPGRPAQRPARPAAADRRCPAMHDTLVDDLRRRPRRHRGRLRPARSAPTRTPTRPSKLLLARGLARLARSAPPSCAPGSSPLFEEFADEDKHASGREASAYGLVLSFYAMTDATADHADPTDRADL